ncbi:MAG TPA: GntR family transcriptional regulator, partial [Mycobacteriales bacterium]|nr:GntR family transcriptional regulator [Mycobacteriales bacterium]
MSVVKQYRLAGPGANGIVATIERAISEGRIPAGGRLPTVRALAEELQVSPATVAAAYRRLRERGIAAGSGRRGTTVNPRPPLPARGAAPVPPSARNLADGTPDPRLLPPLRPALRRLHTEHRPYGSPVLLPELVELARASFAADRIP